MKGLVVVICAPSQGGKDFIATKTMKDLSVFDINSSYASVYKVREQRENDGDHIKCVKSVNDVPIEKEHRIEATIYGTQTIIYNKNEIQQKLDNGEVVFIATGSPELAKMVKAEYGEQCVNVFVQVQQVSIDQMLEEDLKRYGIDKNSATDEQIDASKNRVLKRVQAYQVAKIGLYDFVQDDNLGANHIFKNYYTLVGGQWNQKIDSLAEGQFIELTNKILSIYSLVNKDKDWEEHFSLSKEERQGVKNLFTLQDDWLEYLEQKYQNEP